MIFINHFKTSASAKEYHGHLSQGDYFAKGEVMTPTYEGKTAAMLGLEGMQADKESWSAICDNRNPLTGEKLTARDKDNRRIMTDLTFDVPKSVTLAGVVDKRINGAVDESIRETMADIESEMQVRVRKGGRNEDRTTGNLMYVMWSHETARPLEDGTVDPQKHRHVTVLNVSYDAQEEAYKACQFGNIVRDKAYYQAAYHARLGKRLAEMGYGVEKDGNSFQLSGIDKGLSERFSRRHAVIDAAATEMGTENPTLRAKLARSTRKKKGDELGSEALRQEWLARMTPEEQASLRNARGAGMKDGKSAGQSLDHAIEHLTYHHSSMSVKKLKAEALTYGVGSVLPVDIDQLTAKDKRLIHVDKDGQQMATTREVLKDETGMLQYARDGRGRYAAFGDQEGLEELSEEQRKAAKHVLNSRDAIVGIRGGAGTGKTRMMKATIAAIEKEKPVKVSVFAPSAQASRGVLKEEGFEDANTLESLLRNEKTQAKVKDQVIWVDEAGMIGTRDMCRLIDVAKKQNARLILSGDYRQHGSVQAGDSFRLLEKEAGVKFAELKEIKRQKDPAYKDAVKAISSGTKAGAQKGFQLLDKMGAIVEASGEERHKLLVDDYLKAVDDKKSALIIAPTHREGEKLTQELRDALRMRGDLRGVEHAFVTRKTTNWTDAQKRDARNYEEGMVVEFYQNASGGFKRGECALVTGKDDLGHVTVLRQDGTRSALPSAPERFQVYRTNETRIAVNEQIRIGQNGNLLTETGKEVRVNNGDIFKVKGFTKEGDIELAGGKVLPKTYGHFGMGYVDTSHAAQGKTVDRVYIAAGDASVLAVNSQQWYVSVSRGREQAKIYVDSKQDVREAIGRTGERLSAVELVKGTRFQKVKEGLEQNRISRYWRERREETPERKKERTRGYGR